MDVITEIHDYEELKRAIKIGVQCIGINNRNLKTLEIDINLFKKLSRHIPQNIIKICESGISENNQLKKINEEGADAFLIGEFLMKQQNIYNATKDLIQMTVNLSHIEKNKAKMVDISSKKITKRIAIAEARVVFSKKTFNILINDGNTKGEIFSTARIAGIQAAKKTSELIPLCHKLNLDEISVDFDINIKKRN